MKPSRHLRLFAAFAALFCMLYMQLAVASYACPNLSAGRDGAGMAMSPHANMEDMPGCAGMDAQQPSLCHAHSHAGNQALDKPELPQMQPFVAVETMQALIFIDTVFRPLARQPGAPLLQHAIAPPLSIRNCCFRI